MTTQLPQHIHLIGAGGTGLSAIGRVLHELGITVSGSDRQPSPLSQALADLGITIHYGHRPENIAGAQLVLRSSAVPLDNPEVQAALAAGIPVLRREEFFELLLAGRDVLAVAGTHGKTTTTAMLALILEQVGQQPGYIIGAPSMDLGGNAAAGNSAWFVIEADEYDYMFLGLTPRLAILTNVEHDHPDFFPTPEVYQQAFQRFVERLRSDGWLIACADDPGAIVLAGQARNAGCQVRTYAIDQPADVSAIDLHPAGGAGYRFTAVMANGRHIPVSLLVPGRHNVLNALAALAAAEIAGLDMDAAATALGRFHGAGRRFERLGRAAGVEVIDDYAHHPTEIRAVLQAAGAAFPDGRLWAVWQPHTVSRWDALKDDFATAFGKAGQVIILPVYAARDKELVTPLTSAMVAAAIQHDAVRPVESLDAAVELLAKETNPGDVVLVLSAGDATRVSRQLFERLHNQQEETR